MRRSTVILVAPLLLAVCCAEPDLEVVVQLSGPEDTCDFFTELEVAVVVTLGAEEVAKRGPDCWDFDAGRLVFGFPWPDGVIDGQAALATFSAMTDQEAASGETTFVARPAEHVTVDIDAECMRLPAP